MTIVDVSRRMLAGIAFTLLSVFAAQAGSIYTPLITAPKNNTAVCIANNSHTASVTLTVQLISGINVDASKSCTMPAAGDIGCVLKQKFTQHTTVKCKITMTGAGDAGLTNAQVAERVRGILYTNDTASVTPISELPEDFMVRAR